jgi:hypothetical protein
MENRMSYQSGFLDEDALGETLRLGGWLLAKQMLTAARGETPMPLVVFSRDDLDTPQVLAPRMSKSDVYHDHVIAAKSIIGNQEGRLQRWALVYDRDLEDSGRALIVETGFGEPFGAITFSQRYTFSPDSGLRIIDDLQLIGQEFLQQIVREKLGLCQWRNFVTEGAAHALPGQQWPAWPSASEYEKVRLEMGKFSFAIPEGWIHRRTEDGNGWVIAKPAPWERWELEPVIIVCLMDYSGQMTLEDLIERTKARLLGRGGEIVKAEISGSPSPSLSSKVGRIDWKEREEGVNLRAERWVPTDSPSRFLLLSACSFDTASWEGLQEALESVLVSLVGRPRGWLSMLRR